MVNDASCHLSCYASMHATATSAIWNNNLCVDSLLVDGAKATNTNLLPLVQLMVWNVPFSQRHRYLNNNDYSDNAARCDNYIDCYRSSLRQS